jgi:hypothetical protein
VSELTDYLDEQIRIKREGPHLGPAPHWDTEMTIITIILGLLWAAMIGYFIYGRWFSHGFR